MRKLSLLAWGVLGLMLVGLPACKTDPTGSGANTAPSASVDDEPVRLREVPAPPGLDVRLLTPFTGPAQARAQLSLTEVLAQSPQPEWLQPAERNPAISDDVAPPLAAQKMYASGRLALQDGDNFQAVQQFEKALRLIPGNARLLSKLGQAWARAGNRVSAANFFRKAYAADPSDLASLLTLGRFAFEDRRWDEAIAALHHALELTNDPPAELPALRVDPATPVLLQFYLAGALNEAGYARAAAGVYSDYLAADREFSRATDHGRELSVLDAQRGETLILVGDLYHRLNEPQPAWQFYDFAREVGTFNQDALQRRLIYTRLRLGQPRAAADLATTAVVQARGSAESLALIDYVVEHGASAEALAARLTQLYESEGQPAALALAMADVLPRASAMDLLQQHAQAKPGDAAVFDRLIVLRTTKEASGAEYAAAVRSTLTLMQQTPAEASLYADRLISLAADDERLKKTVSHEAETAESPETAAAAFTLWGKILLADGELAAGQAQLEAALERDPQQRLARIELASLYANRGDFAAAEAMLEALPDSLDPRVAELRVRALTKTGRTDEALALLDELLRRSAPGSPLAIEKADLLLKLAGEAQQRSTNLQLQAAANNGQADLLTQAKEARVQAEQQIVEAERILLDVLSTRPTDEAIYETLLEIYNNNGNMSRNYQRLVARMIDTIPRARVTRLELAALQLASSDFAAAEKLLTDLLRENAEDADAQVMMVEVYARTNRREAFLTLLDRYLARADGAWDPELSRAAEPYLRQIGDEARLTQVIERRLAEEAPSFQRDMTLAQLRFQQKRYPEVVAAVRDALTFSVPQEPQLVYIVGHLFTESMLNTVEAPATIAQTIALMEQYPPLGPASAFILSNLYTERNEPASSRLILEQALKLYPDEPQLNNGVGYALAMEGVRLEEAKRLIQVAVDAEPLTAAYLDSMGWVYYKQGDFENALQWLERSRAADGGQHAVILDHLGDTLFRLGRPVDAVGAWAEARKVLEQAEGPSGDPEEKGLDERLAQKIASVGEPATMPLAPLGEGITAPPLIPAVEADAEVAAPAVDQP